MSYRWDLPFESFNARVLEPEEVARSFVPPDQYFELIKPNHTLLVGPRGSGKTTLMKMMLPSAVNTWLHADAERVRKTIQYVGVFVPFDIAWKEQLNSLQEKLEPDEARLLGGAAFNTHVLKSFITSLRMIWRNNGDDQSRLLLSDIALTRQLESKWVSAIADEWCINPEIDNLAGVSTALYSRLNEIEVLASQLHFMSEEDRARRLESEKFLHLQFLPCLSYSLEVLESLGVTLKKWALLFDELELAPDGILQLLLKSIRSRDSRFLFKLSLSPITPDFSRNIQSAWEGHDHSVIELWYPRKESNYNFSKMIVMQMLGSRDIQHRSPEAVFGRSVFEAPHTQSPKQRSAYRKGAHGYNRFHRLAEKDPSFASYLRAHEIDLDSLVHLPENEMATIRKLIGIVTVREAFLKWTSGKNGRRSEPRPRKNPAIYSGETALYDVSEGNPRILIGLIDRLLSKRTDNDKVPRRVQSPEIQAIRRNFRAFLKTIPVDMSTTHGARDISGFLAVIEKIGEHFKLEVFGEEFNPEPSLSFRVDDDVPPALCTAIGQAINAGAVIMVADNNSDNKLGDIRGRRLRLSYLIATEYNLPLMLTRSRSLSSILSGRLTHPRLL